MLRFVKSLFGPADPAALDDDLVAHVLANLKREPSDQLRAMLDPPAVGMLSAEAVHAARLLLEQRAQGLSPEPVYRTSPRTPAEQAAWERGPVAPRFNRKLLEMDVGSVVHCRWRKMIGIIIRWDDDKDEFYVRYPNGDGDWVSFSKFEEF